MTALKEYQRLECAGLWRPEPEAQRQNVVVNFGDASLAITDGAGRVLSHWSLAAVERVNPGEMPALYAPSAEALELLELEDETMIEAVERVRQVIARRRPREGWLRRVILWGGSAALAVAAFVWLPGALTSHTVRVVPEPTRAELGGHVFRAIGRVSGAPCRSPRGDRALARLHTRLRAPEKGGLLVLRGGITNTVALPGGLILMNRALVEDYESPDVVAGYILAEATRSAQTDPLERLLEHAGLIATIRLLTTGALPEAALDAYAEELVTAPQAPVPDEALLARFAEAKLATTPYAYAVDVTGEGTLPLIEADPMRGGGAEPVLEDADWVALQGICGE
ncbi:hypothetical protein FHY55_05110 [Oceanicola sp. D3]|uniref:hypothetical protein n=1 Tax=Oceanicola sp. D3 TaxID=2587163 RepID=UPI0011217F43|nr:hypothetical protein [Oceanicola sp. D3]QDC08657.1 hypothetical protein FHY55_05110 [Oceanicola sp. D3]